MFVFFISVLYLFNFCIVFFFCCILPLFSMTSIFFPSLVMFCGDFPKIFWNFVDRLILENFFVRFGSRLTFVRLGIWTVGCWFEIGSSDFFSISIFQPCMLFSWSISIYSVCVKLSGLAFLCLFNCNQMGAGKKQAAHVRYILLSSSGVTWVC